MKNRELNEKQESNTNTRDFVIGAIVGAVAGAAAALLLTPRSGRELRTSINERSVSILEKTEQVKDKAMTKSIELASVAKEKANSIANTVSQQSSDLLHKARNDQNQEDPQSHDFANSSSGMSEEIQRKLAETQSAFDETERKLNQ
ncbi:YtxH domain-containing protein [Bacillus sp. B15-48]|uniref:YtxH domain-containing protein n=1 Tax=Bacillus sp. B15-48 TaxID=1548601 RepID=UPI00193F1656|nr:YtxH domain-containing protein [Bacillus sp. B15-48]MBM4762596.1 YtxH domain-containing protein [Bacillus sp. B15-48]